MKIINNKLELIKHKHEDIRPRGLSNTKGAHWTWKCCVVLRWCTLKLAQGVNVSMCGPGGCQTQRAHIGHESAARQCAAALWNWPKVSMCQCAACCWRALAVVVVVVVVVAVVQPATQGRTLTHWHFRVVSKCNRLLCCVLLGVTTLKCINRIN